MKINYSLTKQDYLDFNIQHTKHSPTIRKSILINRYLVPVIFMFVPFFAEKQTSIPILYWFGIFSIVYILWAIFYPKYYTWEISRKVLKLLKEDKYISMIGERSLALTKEGIIETSSQNESKVKWESVGRINETKEHIFIYISPVSAFIIPTRSFKDIAEKEEFRKQLDMYIKP